MPKPARPFSRDAILLVILAMLTESNDEFAIVGPEPERARPLAAVQVHDFGHIREAIGEKARYVASIRHDVPTTDGTCDYGAGR